MYAVNPTINHQYQSTQTLHSKLPVVLKDPSLKHPNGRTVADYLQTKKAHVFRRGHHVTHYSSSSRQHNIQFFVFA